MREKILSSARVEFARRGFDRATLRGIAQRAGCDAALVCHYFGSKERLFALAMRLDPSPLAVPVAPCELGRRALTVEAFVRGYLRAWDAGEARLVAQGLLRSLAIGPQVAFAVPEVLATRAVVPLAHGLGIADADRRSGLVGAHLIGLILARHVTRMEPLVSMRIDQIASAATPAIECCLLDEPNLRPCAPPGSANDV